MLNSTTNNLEQHLQNIAIPRDPFFASGNHFFVREYIRENFSLYGDVEVHNFTFRGENYQNLILHLPSDSQNLKKKPILVGAHYDTVPNTSGADDNATGVAVLLELARYFSIRRANHPLILVAFDMEEYGLLGSQAYAQLLSTQAQPLRLMLSLEMLGYTSKTQTYPPLLKYLYPGVGDFIALVGNLATLREMLTISRYCKQKVPCQWLLAGLKGHIVPDTRRSDHAPFWDQGYKALMVTDTANLRNPHYHQPSDTLDTLDLDFLTQVSEGLKVAIARL